MFKQIKTLIVFKTYKYKVDIPDYKPWLLYVREECPGKPVVLSLNDYNIYNEKDFLKNCNIDGYIYMGTIETLDKYQHIAYGK